MSVYTHVTRSQLEFFFDRYTLGSVVSFQGIFEGIDNSNYFVDTTQGQFVLTLFELFTLEQLPPYIKLLTQLSHYHIPCPTPQLDKKDNALRSFLNKPAAVFKRLTGKMLEQPNTAHCYQVGLLLAEIHDCIFHYDFPIAINVIDECVKLFRQVSHLLSREDRLLIQDELAFQAKHYPNNLPVGVIHGDLFRDNVLFNEDQLTGILDFYSAGKAELLLDIAITINDWCTDDSILNPEKVTAFLSAYESLRPLQAEEKQHWNTVLRASALRFWLSRLVHQFYPRTGVVIQSKDPLSFQRLLSQHRQAV